MYAHDMIATMIDAAGGQIEGRTVIQKLSYFATVTVPNIEKVSYRHYFYGPFSVEVAAALDDMTAFLYLDEVNRSALYDSYKYILTESGQKYAGTVPKMHPNESNKIRDIVDSCKNICQLQGKPLSLAAKVHYIKAHDRGDTISTPEEIRSVALSCYDWNLSKEDTSDGIEVLKKLGFSNES